MLTQCPLNLLLSNTQQTELKIRQSFLYSLSNIGEMLEIRFRFSPAVQFKHSFGHFHIWFGHLDSSHHFQRKFFAPTACQVL